MSIVKPYEGGGELVERPDYLKEIDKTEWGTEELVNYIVPPRVKVIQALTGKELKDKHGEGSAILMPQEIKLVEKDGSFMFTPVFFFVEWCTWNPLAMKGSLPAIRERSIDPNSEIARKSRDPNVRKEKCPENQTEEIMHCEHLNFVAVVHGISGLENLPIVLTFTRGDHKQGTNLNSLIQMRRAPLYSCIFQAHVKEVNNQKGQRWWAIVPENPVGPAWVSQEDMEAYKEIHASMKEAQDKIQVDYGDEVAGEVVGNSGEF